MKSKLIRMLDIAGLAIVLLFAIGGLLWIGNNSLTLKRQFQQAQDRSARELMDLGLAQKNLLTLKTALGQLRSEMSGLYLRIPLRVEMGSLVNEFTARMKERQITLVAIQPQPTISEELYAKVPIRLVFHGGFLQIYRFFHDLQTMAQLLVPEKATITGPDAPAGDCQVELILIAFERKAAKAGKD